MTENLLKCTVHSVQSSRACGPLFLIPAEDQSLLCRSHRSDRSQGTGDAPDNPKNSSKSAGKLPKYSLGSWGIFYHFLKKMKISVACTYYTGLVRLCRNSTVCLLLYRNIVTLHD